MCDLLLLGGKAESVITKRTRARKWGIAVCLRVCTWVRQCYHSAVDWVMITGNHQRVKSSVVVDFNVTVGLSHSPDHRFTAQRLAVVWHKKLFTESQSSARNNSGHRWSKESLKRNLKKRTGIFWDRHFLNVCHNCRRTARKVIPILCVETYADKLTKPQL